MKCEQVGERLTLFAMGDLDASERDRIELHLKTCPGCGAILREIRSTLDVLQGALAATRPSAAALSGGRRERALHPLPRWRLTIEWVRAAHPGLARAAALAAVAFIIVGLVLPRLGSPRTTTARGGSDQTASRADLNLISSAAAPDVKGSPLPTGEGGPTQAPDAMRSGEENRGRLAPAAALGQPESAEAAPEPATVDELAAAPRFKRDSVGRGLAVEKDKATVRDAVAEAGSANPPQASTAALAAGSNGADALRKQSDAAARAGSGAVGAAQRRQLGTTFAYEAQTDAEPVGKAEAAPAAAAPPSPAARPKPGVAAKAAVVPQGGALVNGFGRVADASAATRPSAPAEGGHPAPTAAMSTTVAGVTVRHAAPSPVDLDAWYVVASSPPESLAASREESRATGAMAADGLAEAIGDRRLRLVRRLGADVSEGLAPPAGQTRETPLVVLELRSAEEGKADRGTEPFRVDAPTDLLRLEAGLHVWPSFEAAPAWFRRAVCRALLAEGEGAGAAGGAERVAVLRRYLAEAEASTVPADAKPGAHPVPAVTVPHR